MSNTLLSNKHKHRTLTKISYLLLGNDLSIQDLIRFMLINGFTSKQAYDDLMKPDFNKVTEA
jgi:hypothetical protein